MKALMCRVVAVLLVVFSFSACVENNYLTAPPAPEQSSAVAPLVLPRFNPSDMYVVRSEWSYSNHLTFNVKANTPVTICSDLNFAAEGSSVMINSVSCDLLTDAAGTVFVQVQVDLKTTGNLGRSTVTLTPRSNPRGASSFRITVLDENQKG